MSAVEQLELDALASRKRGKLSKADQCRCGCFVEEHAATKQGKHTKGCLRCKPECKRFRPRGRVVVPLPAWLAPPDGAEILMRPDTVHPKAMGWRMHAGDGLVAVLDHLKTRTPNDERQTNAAFIPAWAQAKAKRAAMGVHILHSVQKERAFHALVGSPYLARGLPARVELQRVSNSSLELDTDNLAGALKFVRDGVAQALEINDRAFGRTLPTEYSHARAGVPRFYGVVIRLWWSSSAPSSEASP